MKLLLPVLWLFGGLFGGGDQDCRTGEQQGVRTMEQIGEHWPLRDIADPISDYVQRVGLTLARVVDPALRQPWDFYVVRNAEPIAFAVGGGHFIVSDGLIALVRTESELAAVLAHEISHQTLGDFCRGGSDVAQRLDLGAVVQHYDLKTERQADSEAVYLLSVAGYDSGAMMSVLDCLRASDSAADPHLLQRIRALGDRQAEGVAVTQTKSARFERARRSVLLDLGDSATHSCR